MGKRELLLIVGFMVVGVIVYQATAPAPKPGEEGVSISRILSHFRRAVHGSRARADVTHSTTYPVAASTSELRLSGPFSEITVQGEDRRDVGCELRVMSTGYDQAEALGLANRTAVAVDNAGSTINIHVEYPPDARQTAAVTLKVPSRLRIRLEQSGMKTAVTNVAAAEIVSSRGETTLKQIAGRAAITHRGGRLIVEGAGTLKLANRGSEAKVTRIGGDASFDLQGGEVEAGDIAGPIDVETRAGEFTLHAEQAHAPIHVTSVGGTVSLDKVKSDVRVDARNTEVSVTMAAGAASIAIYNEGGEDTRVTPPPGGYQLDAVSNNGHITVPEGTVIVATSGSEQRASGAVNGGGPTITLRAGQGDIVVRTP